MQPVKGQRGQFDITVHLDSDRQNSRTYRTVRIISSYGADPLRGRGTRVFEAVELDGNGEPIGSHVVLKDTWIDNDRAREGNILTSLHLAAQGEDKQLMEKSFLTTICHGDVWTGFGLLDDNAKTLMRGLDIEKDRDSLFQLQRKSTIQRGRSAPRSESLRASSSVQVPHSNKTYAHKTHYRIVFKEIGTTIDRVRSLPEVMKVLTETAGGAF